MHNGENTPPQPTTSGTLDTAGSTRKIQSFARPPNLVGPGTSGSLRPPSQPFGTTQQATLGTNEIEDRRNRFEATPGENSGSLHARSQPSGTFQAFSAPPQVPVRLENNEADSRLLLKDFRQAFHHGSTLSPRSSRNSNPDHGYRAKRKTPPSGFTTPKSAKRNRTLTRG